MPHPEVLNRVCDNLGWPRKGSEIELSLDMGRGQRVRVEQFMDRGQVMVRITTGVGDANTLTASRMQSALKVNHGLAHGALAIHDGKLVLTDTFLACDATPTEIERSVRFVATTADMYEKVLFGTDDH